MVGVVLVHDMQEEEEEEEKLRRQGAADVQLSVDVDHQYVTLAHGPEGVGGGEQFFWGKNWRISKVLLLLFALAWVAALVFKVGVMRRSVIDKEAVDFTALVSSSSSVAAAAAHIDTFTSDHTPPESVLPYPTRRPAFHVRPKSNWISGNYSPASRCCVLDLEICIYVIFRENESCETSDRSSFDLILWVCFFFFPCCLSTCSSMCCEFDVGLLHRGRQILVVRTSSSSTFQLCECKFCSSGCRDRTDRRKCLELMDRFIDCVVVQALSTSMACTTFSTSTIPLEPTGEATCHGDIPPLQISCTGLSWVPLWSLPNGTTSMELGQVLLQW
jgi:hypothetical protein